MTRLTSFRPAPGVRRGRTRSPRGTLGSAAFILATGDWLNRGIPADYCCSDGGLPGVSLRLRAGAGFISHEIVVGLHRIGIKKCDRQFVDLFGVTSGVISPQGGALS